MWLRWLVPSTTPAPPEMTTTNALRTRRRRSVALAPPVGKLIPPVRRATTPVPPNFLEDDETFNPSKRVNFVEPTLPNIRSESVQETEAVPMEGEPLTQAQAQAQAQLQPPVNGSSRSSLSSSSTLAFNSVQVQMKVDLGDERTVESDTSSRRSLSKRLPKMKNPFVGRGRRQSANTDALSKTRPAGV